MLDQIRNIVDSCVEIPNEVKNIVEEIYIPTMVLHHRYPFDGVITTIDGIVNEYQALMSLERYNKDFLKQALTYLYTLLSVQVFYISPEEEKKILEAFNYWFSFSDKFLG